MLINGDSVLGSVLHNLSCGKSDKLQLFSPFTLSLLPACKFKSNSHLSCLQTPLGDDHQSPWRFDPCQMDANEMSDEPMKILKGRVKILWVHGSNHPNYKLSITVVSKNEACRDKSKHACLKFG